MKVILKYFVLLISIIYLSESSVIYDQVCIRNIGCDTELQDMIFGVPSARVCQALCDQNPECQYFTWWSQGIFEHICMQHQNCSKLDYHCLNCYAGPRTSGCRSRDWP
eukprot:03220.XXX_125292_124587_1 [CDS] Oithona nana genome sequencing.